MLAINTPGRVPGSMEVDVSDGAEKENPSPKLSGILDDWGI